MINYLTINALFVGHSLSMFEQQIGLWSVDLQTFANINRKIVFRKSSTNNFETLGSGLDIYMYQSVQLYVYLVQFSSLPSAHNTDSNLSSTVQ